MGRRPVPAAVVASTTMLAYRTVSALVFRDAQVTPPGLQTRKWRAATGSRRFPHR
jgi:hypothetical protein